MRLCDSFQEARVCSFVVCTAEKTRRRTRSCKYFLPGAAVAQPTAGCDSDHHERSLLAGRITTAIGAVTDFSTIPTCRTIGAAAMGINSATKLHRFFILSMAAELIMGIDGRRVPRSAPVSRRASDEVHRGAKCLNGQKILSGWLVVKSQQLHRFGWVQLVASWWPTSSWPTQPPKC